MLGEQQSNLGVLPGGGAAWHCAMHGTVTKCPFVYMSCEETDTPDHTPTYSVRTCCRTEYGLDGAADEE